MKVIVYQYSQQHGGGGGGGVSISVLKEKLCVAHHEVHYRMCVLGSKKGLSGKTQEYRTNEDMKLES